MAASREEIRGWFDEAKAEGATHMVVVCDTFEYDDYPVSIMPGESVMAKVQNPGEMQRVMEVYAMHLDRDAQLAEHRAYHVEAPPAAADLKAIALRCFDEAMEGTCVGSGAALFASMNATARVAETVKERQPGSNVIPFALRRSFAPVVEGFHAPEAAFVKGSDTSEVAAHAIAPSAAKLRARVYAYVKGMGLHGATCDEAENNLDLKHQTCSPRFTELREMGAILDSGNRRPTRNGRSAAVYLANPDFRGEVDKGRSKKAKAWDKSGDGDG